MKKIVITGCTSGIGKELTQLIAHEEFHMILIGRNEKLLNNLVLELKEINSNGIYEYALCDFSKPKEVYKKALLLGEAHPVIDIIIHNAGALPSKKGVILEDGLPFALGVNYYSPKAITEALLPSLLKSEDPLIFHTTSLTIYDIQKNNIDSINEYKRIKAYATSKTSFYLYLQHLHEKNQQINMKMFDPRIVYTNAVKGMMPKGFKWLSFLARIVARPAHTIAKKALKVLSLNQEGFHNYRLDKEVKAKIKIKKEDELKLLTYLDDKFKVQ